MDWDAGKKEEGEELAGFKNEEELEDEEDVEEEVEEDEEEGAN